MALPMENRGARSSIQVIERMMRLIDVLAWHGEPVALKQITRETGLHPSTAHRILSVMVESRFADRVEPGCYRLGIRLLELGHIVKSRINVRQEALFYMQRLHAELNETVNLSVRRSDEMVYVERTSSNPSMMQVIHIIGARAPLHITAVGKIFLLEDGSEAAREYASRTGLTAYTENTLRDVTSLMKELEQIRKRGYAFDNEEAERGVSCIGAGIRDDEGRLIAGLSVSAPSDRLQASWGPKVKVTADRISEAIGYRPAADR
jgi:DNA-binding IclR family transcriptional regulator